MNQLSTTEPRSLIASAQPTIVGNGRPKTSNSYSPIFDRPSDVLFLDIETTGLSRYYDYLTLIGYQLNGQYNVVLADQDPAEFVAALRSASSVVTFNGSGFDLPFLESTFGPLPWPKHHIDLRYACRKLGLTGGQKKIEEILNIACRDDVQGVDGAMAVLLWHRYLRGDHDALRELIEYNRADVRAMTFILDHVMEALAPSDLLSRLSELHSFCSTPDVRRGIAHTEASLPSPPTHLRPQVSFEAIFNGTKAENATIVGLDITGSASRPSGYCIMQGSHAETARLGEDDEIVARILEVAPDLVSIDSPLCLPVGRTMVTDDDPRRFCGIMRQSERILKRRGINVYPCLIQSMQRLTERGINLATRIRSHGIPVIECYPGAAQDIMGIPRKGAGNEWLTLGMSEFGVSGRFVNEPVSHDELDAITCALVGSFHLAGRTEALGGRGEEPMIVPDLSPPQGVVIGISGEIAAGKTTAARYLERQGFAYTRISSVIDDILKERKEELTRANRQRVGLELHEQKGQRWLCRKAIERLGPETPALIVIDGLRWPEDARYFSERFGGRFHHIHIEAPQEIRRCRMDMTATGEAFDQVLSHPVEDGISQITQSAHIRIQNIKDIPTLEDLIESAWKSAKEGIANAN